MKLIRQLMVIPTDFVSGSVVTLGNFDGVHIGHQAMLNHLILRAKALNLPSLVILFEPQPAEFFQGGLAPARLTSLREKLVMLKALGVDYVSVLRFTKQLSQMLPEDFLNHILLDRLNARSVIVGHDFRFGQQRLGTVDHLKIWANIHAIEISAFQDVVVGQVRVSSTLIRKALQQSDFCEVKGLLGRPYTLCGRVMPGDGRGRQWGIPTANIALHREVVPLLGVFCVQVNLPNGMTVLGVANLGRRPTVEGTRVVFEVHLLDFEADLYGCMLKVTFLDKIRDEKRFSSVDELIAQIHRDIDEARMKFQMTLRAITI